MGVKKAGRMPDAFVFCEWGAVQAYCPLSKTKMEGKGKKKTNFFSDAAQPLYIQINFPNCLFFSFPFLPAFFLITIEPS